MNTVNPPHRSALCPPEKTTPGTETQKKKTDLISTPLYYFLINMDC